MTDKKIAIVGAGLTGLTIAYHLKNANISYAIFERKDRPGGVIQTNKKEGFIYESGPNSGMLSNVETIELTDALSDKCTVEVADSSAKRRLIWKGKRWHAMPSGLIGGVTTPLFSFSDKLRILKEPFVKKGTAKNETLAELVKRRMGKSFLDYAIDPFILGIYSGNPAKLITKYAFPKLYNLEQNYGSFIKGAIQKKRESKPEAEQKVTKEIFSVEGGLSNLIDALVKEVGEENIYTDCENLQFAKSEKGFAASIMPNANFTHVISTSGVHLDRTFPFIDRADLRRINKMEYSKVIQIAIGFKKWQGISLDAFGGLVPFKENRDVLGVLFLSTIFNNRAPKDGALLSVFIGGTRRKELVELADDEVKRMVAKEMKAMMGLADFNPDIFEIFRYQYAIPQYGFESEDKLNAIATIERENKGLILAGNVRDGIGIADRIKQGKNIAELVVRE